LISWHRFEIAESSLKLLSLEKGKKAIESDGMILFYRWRAIEGSGVAVTTLSCDAGNLAENLLFNGIVVLGLVKVIVAFGLPSTSRVVILCHLPTIWRSLIMRRKVYDVGEVIDTNPMISIGH